MKIGRSFKLAAGTVLALTIVLFSSYAVGAAVTSAKFTGDWLSPYTKGHADAGTDVVASGQCVQCHTATIPGNALSGNRSAHQIHLASLFVAFGRMTDGETGNKNGCVTCHPDSNTSNYLSVQGAAVNTPVGYEGDVSYAVPAGGNGSTTDATSSLRRNVDPEFCVRCHGSLELNAPTGHGGVQPTGCRFCHAGTAHGATSASEFINLNFANGDQPDARCLRCHGAFQWYQVSEYNKAAADAATP